ncbi:MAG: SDR family oxidoreductase [Rhodobacteraceae bacterium]|nr:SDR family oxidoreductase [Paracoccaceae bacterium]
MSTARKLDGKVAIVSGSGRGIGRAIALKLASEGARVLVNDLDPEPGAETVALIEASGGEAALCAGDLSDPAFAQVLVDAATDRWAALDIIVNNAGYTWDSVIQKMTDDQFAAVMDIHVAAPFRVLRAASGFIREAAKAEAAEGRVVHRKVVNISSVAGLYGNAGQVNYSAAKAAIVGLTRTLCKEWGRYRVNVNAVAFGLVNTRMTQPLARGEDALVQVGDRALRMGVQEAMLDDISRLTPLGRGATPEEAAGAVYLFCIPESDYISGQVLVAGGGLLI